MSSTCLTSAPLRSPLVVTTLDPGESARRRLAELGLRPGVEARVVQRTAGGGVVVAVAGSRLGIDARTARGIFVRPGVTLAEAAAEEASAARRGGGVVSRLRRPRIRRGARPLGAYRAAS